VYAAWLPTNQEQFKFQQITWHCANYSYLPCIDPQGKQTDATGILYQSSGATIQTLILSFGQDNRGILYMLTNSGVYQIVNQALCGMGCINISAGATVAGAGVSAVWCAALAALLLTLPSLGIFTASS